ncbi:MAG: hypothetical protein ACOC80_15820 [Petrotogales bacterium]
MSKTYFISGHRNITEEEFIKHYEPILWNKINESDVSFVVGDCEGVDDLAQKYLKAMGVKEVTIYHMFDNPRHNAGFTLIGNFNSDVERDFAMTKASDADIAWVRDFNQKSRTKDNLERRKWYNNRIAK